MTKNQFVEWLKRNSACEGGLAWAMTQTDAKNIVENCPKAEWLIWLVGRVGGEALVEYEITKGPEWHTYWKSLERTDEEYTLFATKAWTGYMGFRGEAARTALTFDRVVEVVVGR